VKPKLSDRNGPVRNVTDYNDVIIGQATYILASALEGELNVSRQTLWRWRAEDKIPAGHVYRKQLVFTEEEADLVRKYANRVEPARPNAPRQMGLFRSRGGRK
jgi:beta-N-acetylglucosaminidase